MGWLSKYQIDKLQNENNNEMAQYNIFLSPADQICKLSQKEFRAQLGLFKLDIYLIEKLEIMRLVIQQKPYEAYEICCEIRDAIQKFKREHENNYNRT